MKYSIVFKFLAIALCALVLLGAIGSGLVIVCMTELGLYDGTVEEMREQYLRSDGASLANILARSYAEAQLGNMPEALMSSGDIYDLGVQGKSGWFYGVFNPKLAGLVLKDAVGNVLQSVGAENPANGEVYSFPVSGAYRYALSVTQSESRSYETDAVTYDEIPEGGAAVCRITVSYESSSESSGGDRQIGFIQKTAYGVRFESTEQNLISLPTEPTVGVTFTDENDNVLYHIHTDVSDCFSEDGDGYLIFDTAPMLSRTQAAPDAVSSVGTEIYDAVFSSESEQDGEGTMGLSNGEEPVGVLSRNDVGVLFFRVYVPIRKDNFPEDAVITAVEFRDENGEPVYQAENPAGVGEFEWNGDSALTFLIAPSMTVHSASLPDETVPETTAETTPETTAAKTAPEAAAETAPEATEIIPAETLLDAMHEADSDKAPDKVLFTDNETHTLEYWNPESQSYLTVTYRYAQLPDYTLELTVAPGGYRFDSEYALLGEVWNVRNQLFFILGGCLLLFAVLAVYLCCAAGRKPGSDLVHAAGFNCIPLDIYLAGAATVIFGLGALIVHYTDDLLAQSVQTACAGVLGAGYLICLTFVSFCFACAAQFKTPGGYWWRDTLCWRCLNLMIKCCKGFFAGCGWLLRKLPKFFSLMWDAVLVLLKPLRWLWAQIKKGVCRIGKSINRVYSLMPLTWQWLLTGFIMVVLLFVSIAGRSNLMVVLSLCACVAVVLYGAYCFGILLESAKSMSKGDLDTKVDDKYLTGAFRSFAGELNDLAGVAVVAAQKQLKSERMKTELITNVSHDIKTPLTSIINYVDLLQKPHTADEEKAYLEVLSRQSQRLKKLIEDLMEMSKASTGNLTADITRLDAVEAVNQALGEFADKLEKAQLTPVFRHPEEPVAMMADGRLAWRVLSNLLSNAVKYALPGTRVYIDVMALEGKVIISLKNISRDELNVDADELMERFVRGDDSRNTEGSGLGLNIAKTLMELQKGQLQLLVDGDLFKVTLIFPGA